MSFFRSVPWLILLSSALWAQDTATIAGAVVDSRESGISGAEVSLRDLGRGAVRQTTTNARGRYVFDALPPGDYELEVSKDGFRKVKVEPIRLAGRDRRSFVVELPVAPAQPDNLVEEATSGISFDPASATGLDRGFAEFLPLESRRISSLLLLAPGLLPSGAVPSANGLAPGANYITVDGAKTPADELPGLAFDAVQAVDVQASAAAPEFGRTAGAQVAVTTRSGANAFHGSFFGLFRNRDWAANDWLANSLALERGELRHRNVGAGAGGPLLRDRTYFFAAYEALRADSPQTAFAAVPSLEARRAAVAELRPFLEAFPAPNRVSIPAQAAAFAGVYSNRTELDSASVRLDHSLSSTLALFARYQHAPRSESSRAPAAPNVLTNGEHHSKSFTAALTWTPVPRATHDFRVNYSLWDFEALSSADSFGGATPLERGLWLPAGVRDGALTLRVLGAGGYMMNARTRTRQRQLHIVDTLSYAGGTHQWRFGVDYRRLAPTEYFQPYQTLFTFYGFTPATGGLLSGTAAAANVMSNEPAVYPLHINFSVYAQDTWRATSRTTLIWGLRWDLNPAPDVRRGAPPIAFKGFANFPEVSRIDPLYQTRWRDIGPRFGIAYQLDTTPGAEMMFRFGVGILFDPSYAFALNSFRATPYVNQRNFVGAAFPLTTEQLQPLVLPAVRPYGMVAGAESDLRAPRVWVWNASLERYIGRSQSLVLTYAAAKARDLLKLETRRSYSELRDDGSADYDVIEVISNKPSHNYQSLQLQFRRRLSARAQAQLSYTYSHAIESGAFRRPPRGMNYVFEDTRQDSEYDVRHTLSFAGSFAFPAPGVSGLRQIFGGWATDWRLTARSGLPFEAAGMVTMPARRVTVQRLYALVRPNIVRGESLWLDEAGIPGGRRLNPAAFTLPTDYANGTLPRNALRGFELLQADLAIRRRFPFRERARLDVFAQAFNVLNRANFTDPAREGTALLASPLFGLSAPWNAPWLGPAPRSLQLGFRWEF